MRARLLMLAGRSAGKMNGFGIPLRSSATAASPASRSTLRAKRTRKGNEPACWAASGSIRSSSATVRAAPVCGEVGQLGGLGDRLGTELDIAGQPAPEVGLDARNHGLALLLSVRVGRVIGSTEPR
jgi:hypothetical protein